jgi:hypothetical protein
MFQVAKQIPFDNPNVLNACRAFYVLSNLVIVGIYYYISLKIDKKKGTLCFVARDESANPLALPDMTTLKYVEPAPMGSSEEAKLVTTTVHAYDKAQLKGAIRSQLMGVGMMGVMHLYFKYTNPLLIQSIIPLKGVFEGNLTKVYLYGQPATGDLKRPWKAAGGFMQAMSGGEVMSDKKAVEAAERAGRGGVKEE